MNIEQIRLNFPQLMTLVHAKPLVYFDNAATTLKPQSMIDSIKHYYTSEVANVHRGVHSLSEEGTKKFETTRIAVQNFINARHSHEIIYTKGTTDSLNLLASSFGRKFLNPDDIILLSTLEHHSNIVPWQMIAEITGAKVVEVPINDQGEIILDEYKKLLTNKVKIVSIAHVSNTLGTINPIKEMIKLAHDIGAKFCVDAAQSAAHIKIDVQDLDCDFLAFSAHKVFGPNGLGILFGKEELLNELPPYQGGGAMISEVTFAKTTYNTLPNKFEAGTPVIAEVIAFKESLDFINLVGIANIHEREDELLKYATEKIKMIEGIRIIGTAKNKSSVLSFVIDGCHPQDLGTLLDQQGIAIRTGHHCTQPLMKRMNTTATARASFSFYNTHQEIDIFINGILKAISMLK
jgi:cysteine desulfurase/selenocysteine lyase